MSSTTPSNLYAGAATCDITPLDPLPLYGYPHVERISTGVHDPLAATVIVLRRGGRTVVLASLDILMIGPTFARKLRAAVAGVVGCDEAGVLISCTHTHSGPVTSRLVSWRNDPMATEPDEAYMARIKEQTLAAVTNAVNAMAPAELAWAQADATGVGGNRLSDDGPTDPAFGVLMVRHAATRRPMAASVIYGMHPTVMHEDSPLISGDFPHYTRVAIREHLHTALPISYHMAPAGNQSSRRFVTGQTFAEAERLGRTLGRSVCESLEAVSSEAWRANPELAGRMAQVRLPRNRIRPLDEAKQLLAEYVGRYEQLQREQAPRVEVRTAECAVFGAEGALALADADADGSLAAMLADYNPVDVQVLRIGETDLVGLPGECFVEYGLEIRSRSPRQAYVISLANGELQGYIVTPEAADAGGYEATNSVFAPEAGAMLVETALELCDENREDDNQ